MTRQLIAMLAAIVLLSAASSASAESVRWCLEDAIFEAPDGTSLTGYFDYDAAQSNPSLRVTGFDIQSEAYGDFPGTRFVTPTGYATVDTRPAVVYNGFIFYPDTDTQNNEDEPRLKLRTVVDEIYFTDLLADESVTEISLTNTNQSVECLNCSPARRLASGRVVRSPPSSTCGAPSSPNSVPMMPAWGLFLMASLVGLFGARKLFV